MTIPNPTNFPVKLDTDDNLFLVHDSLRVRLLEDYNPGDTSILIEGNSDVITRFPPTGIITLTEQCSEIDKRAISLYYGSRTSGSFDELEILSEFTDVIKPKKITNVTMNVLDKHHNHLKDSLIAIETFLGVKNQTDISPFGETITGRINFLKNIVYKPRAWFTITNDLGLVPLEVVFKDDSFRKGDGNITYTWSTRLHNDTQEDEWDVIKVLDKSAEFSHTYAAPGVYDVMLTVSNDYGEDSVIFEKSVTAKIEAPKEAVITIIPRSSQKLIQENPPIIRTSTNTFIDLEVPIGVNPLDSDYSYSGELLGYLGDDVFGAIDPVVEYTWKLNDELIHTNTNYTKASYSIGGYDDLILRVDTKFGAYRITKYSNAIDIIENQNLWLFNLTNENSNSSGTLETWEFGLLSETFKLLGNQTISFDRDNSFLDEYGNTDIYSNGTEARAKKEFSKNICFAPQGTISSGDKGESVLFWAGGGSTIENQEIKAKKYNAFNDTYVSLSSIANKPWNWVPLVSQDVVYFILGQSNNYESNTNYTNAKRTDYSLSSLSPSSPITLGISSFENGADELLNNPSYYDDNGIPINGYFSVYRSTWKDSTGYVLRNSSVNEFFRMSDFYKTNGSLSSPYNTLTKLPSMTGSVKTEGELVSLSSGVFFFNNSGEISAWNDISLTWEIGRANSSSISFRSLQDSSVSGFDDKSNSLLAASDGDRIVYLSFDYSKNSFIKFNGTDLTFSSASAKPRPTGTQLKLGIY
jgi:PKD repeat protein